MVSILPSERTPFDVIGKDVGRALQGVLPGAVQQGFQRGQGLGAIDQLQEALGAAGGDINKMLPALAKAYTMNPNLERSGLGQQYLQQARVGNAFGQPPSQGQQMGQPGMGGAPASNQTQGQPQPQESTFAAPSPFNIMTPQDMEEEAKRYAMKLGDPNAYQTRYASLQNQNQEATAQRQALEDAALKSHVSPSDLSRFMVVNSHLDPRNPSEWAQNGVRNFNKVKANDQKIQTAFIPGMGQALLGRDREKALNALIPSLQENKKLGLEQEDRAYLADNYLSPTEIESLYHPLTPKHEKALDSLPRGLFPARTGEELSYFAPAKNNPFISYEEAREKDPQALKIMQDRLTDFFINNVDNDTSLLNLREKLWKDKDYDWQQIGPALREAEKKGLKLNSEQGREATIIDTQPPTQSLPDIFRDLSRLPAFFRGNK
jgi:hypothetical protein